MEQDTKNAIEIARLGEKVSGLDKKVDKMLSNDLPHLQMGISNLEEKQDKISEKMAFWAGALAILSFMVPTALFVLGRIWR